MTTVDHHVLKLGSHRIKKRTQSVLESMGVGGQTLLTASSHSGIEDGPHPTTSRCLNLTIYTAQPRAFF